MDRDSLRPIAGASRIGRRRFSLRQELVLALLPTGVVLLVFFLVENLSHQHLLFASLASSAFLIYLDPQHGTNQIGTLFWSQTVAAVAGVLCLHLLGPGYSAAAVAMTVVIMLMILLDIVHPPAVSTALSFAFSAGSQNNLDLFGLALGMIILLVILERVMLHLLTYFTRRYPEESEKT